MSFPLVSFTRSELSAVLDKYTIIRDCIQQRIKDLGDTYLPRPNASDTSQENIDRYNSYLERAVFYDVAGRTINGLVGQMFANDPALVLPTDLEAVGGDANGNGLSITQTAKEAARFAVAYGRCGIYVDYPAMKDGQLPTSKAQLASGEIKPTINIYAPEQIINWKLLRRGAKHVYEMIVLAENHFVPINAYQTVKQTWYKVLRLVPLDPTELALVLAPSITNPNAIPVSGVGQVPPYTPVIYTQDTQLQYVIEIWRPLQPVGIVTTGNQAAKEQVNYGTSPNELYFPKDANGQPLSEIPFTFIGSENNDAEVDALPMLAICELNIAHYRNSADYEEACFVVGQPTYVIAGLDQAWYETVLEKKLQIGSRGGIPLPIGATANILQVAENSMAKEAMDHKEKQMVALGARLVEQQDVQQTATQANINNSAETSILADIAKNISSAFTYALKQCALFTGSDSTNIEFSLNTDFAINRLTPQERVELIAEWQAGAITWDEMRRALTDSGVAFEDSDDAKADIAEDQAARDAQTVATAAAMAAAGATAPAGGSKPATKLPGAPPPAPPGAQHSNKKPAVKPAANK